MNLFNYKYFSKEWSYKCFIFLFFREAGMLEEWLVSLVVRNKKQQSDHRPL